MLPETMVTIKDVARTAGVSVGTVSNVMSNLPTVAEDLRKRVERAIHELKYQPSYVARSLKSKQTHTLAIVISDITNPFFPMVVRGAEDAAAERGYMLSIFNTDDDLQKECRVLEILGSRRVDGLLLVPALTRGGVGHIERLIDRGIPVVCLDRLPDGLSVDCVAVDNSGGVASCIRHFAEQGAKRIAFLGGKESQYIAAERLQGYRTGMREAGLEIIPELIWEGDFRQNSGYQVGKERMPSARADAVFVANIRMTMGFLHAMRELGLEAPRDYLFATFDHIPILDAFSPAMTCVGQPSYEIGRRGVLALMDRIQRVERDVIHQVLPTDLVVGETSRRTS